MARFALAVLLASSIASVVGSPNYTYLLARQGLNIPDSCQSTCSPVASYLTSQNCSGQQCCTADFVNAIRDCFLCIGVAQGIQDYSAPQSILDRFAASCKAQGFDIPTPTLPGEDNNRSSSSFSTSVTESRSQTTISATTPATQSTQNSPTSPTASAPASTTSNSATRFSTSNCFDAKWLGMVLMGLVWGFGRVL